MSLGSEVPNLLTLRKCKSALIHCCDLLLHRAAAVFRTVRKRLQNGDETHLYGVEVKFYNMEVALDEHLETPYKGLYVIGDGSGITHSLSHASASGVYVAREILETV